MKKTAFLLLMLLGSFAALHCETREQRAANPHELIIGWGDYITDMQMFSFSAEHKFDPSNPGEPGHTLRKRFTGSILAGYRYRISSWLGVGAELCFAGALVRERIEQLGYTREFPWNTYRIHIMPEVRFTYLNTPYVNLYSGIGLGFLMRWDNSLLKPLREPSFIIDFSLIGIAIGGERLFFECELSPKFDFRSVIGSPVVSAAIGYRF